MCRRRRNHEVLLFSPRSDEPEAKRIVKTRSLVAARAVSKALLRPHARQTTNALYHEDRRRLWTTSILKPGGRWEEHEAERIIGQSVGERGVW